uniref:Serpentine Receptor, class T n=1 Tax=Steinernema glaseri TaxID=37863 RepID=A0A1I8AH54_9BILA
MLPAETGRIIFGSLYMFLSLAVFPLYSMIIVIFLRVRTFRKHSCYWIMSSLGAFNCLSLIGMAGLGLRVLTAQPFPELVEKFLFAIHRFGLTAASHQACLLAFNRFCVLTGWFTTPKFIYFLFFMGDCVYIFTIIGIFMSSCAGITYMPELATNYYDETLPYTKMLVSLDVFMGFGLMSTALVMYIIITVYLVLKRFSLTTLNRPPISRRELAILIQGIAEFCFEITLMLNALPFIRFISRDSYVYTGCYVIYVILGTGWMCPIMYLVMNRSLRREILSALKCVTTVKVRSSNRIFTSHSGSMSTN